MPLTNWCLPLFNGDAYHLWLKDQSHFLSDHHVEGCQCQNDPSSSSSSDCGVFSLGFCYERTSGRSRNKRTFKKAHDIVERGFKGGFFRSISVVNPPSPLHKDPPWRPEESPYSDLPSKFLPGHPIANVSVEVFQMEAGNQQAKGPAYGNVSFDIRFPVNLILQGKMSLYLLEFAEFGEVMSCRYLLSYRTYDNLVPCDIATIGGPIYFDGKYLHTIKRALNYKGDRLLRVMHELLFDCSTYPYLDSKCTISPNIALCTQIHRAKSDPIFDENDSKEILGMVGIYCKLLDAYNRAIVSERSIMALEDPTSEHKPSNLIHEALDEEEISMLVGYEDVTEIREDFDLTKSLIQAPEGFNGLLKNVVKLFQMLTKDSL